MKKKRIFCSALVACNLLFIWGNSLLPGSVSGDISGGVLAMLLELLGQYCVIGELLIRKLAHFSEFACLGLLLAWLFQLLGQKQIHRFTMPLLFGVLSALTDETIQVFVPQRGPSVVDVWIDTAGICTGIGLLLLGQTIFKRKKSNTLEDNAQ